MKELLVRQYFSLKKYIDVITRSINDSPNNPEIAKFRSWLNSTIDEINLGVERASKYLDSEIEEQQFAVLSQFTSFKSDLQFCDLRFLPSLFRFSKDDVVAYRLMELVHRSHKQAKATPFAISDSSFGIYPYKDMPPLYSLTITDQKSLLHLPLMFHEFGHLLYSFHKRELDDLVTEFRTELSSFLINPSTHNDYKQAVNDDRVKKMLFTWYGWTQEFFCDVVGLYIGGAAFLNSFSYFFQLDGVEAFYRSEQSLELSNHPPTYLRIKILLHFAQGLGISESKRVEKDWNILERRYKKSSDHFGYYSYQYEPELIKVIESMIIETDPQLLFKETGNKMISSLEESWNVIYSRPNEYLEWERKVLKELES